MKTMKDIPFYKVHGAGNDMIIFWGRDLPVSERKKAHYIRKMSHRNLGLGADQVVEILSQKPLSIQIWNGNGTKAEMCANGSRTFLYLAALKKWFNTREKNIPLKISGKDFFGRLTSQGYELSLGKTKVGKVKTLLLDKDNIPYWPVNVGNPHAVIFTQGDSEFAPWKKKDFSYKILGPKVEEHKNFPNKTNVEFVRNWEKKGDTVVARVDAWERGAGATLSCGSGAVAVASVFHQKLGIKKAKILMTDFALFVRFENDQAYLSGPSAFVAEGKLVNFCK